MKTQIRQGIFETNSSSTHAICISNKGNIKIPKEITFSLSYEFGWEWECYNDVDSKAAYLYLAMTYVVNGSIGQEVEEFTNNVNKIRSWLKEDNINVNFDPVRIIFYSWGACLDRPGYLDHGDQTSEFVSWVLKSKQNLYNYLFNTNSCIATGNDNEERELDIPNRDYEAIFEKGN